MNWVLIIFFFFFFCDLVMSFRCLTVFYNVSICSRFIYLFFLYIVKDLLWISGWSRSYAKSSLPLKEGSWEQPLQSAWQASTSAAALAEQGEIVSRDFLQVSNIGTVGKNPCEEGCANTMIFKRLRMSTGRGKDLLVLYLPAPTVPAQARTHNLDVESSHCLSSTEEADFYHTGAHSWHKIPPIGINGS